MSARGITGKRRRPKIHPRSAGPGFSLFDSSLTTHPLLLFSGTDFHPRSASYLEVPFIPAFCLVQRIKGTPLLDSDARPANFIMYILPTTGHLCPKKNGWIRGVFERPKNARVIFTDNCELPRSVVIVIYLFYTSSGFWMADYRECSKFQSIQRWILSTLVR